LTENAKDILKFTYWKSMHKSPHISRKYWISIEIKIWCAPHWEKRMVAITI